MAYQAVHQWQFQEQMGSNSDNYLQIYSDNLADLIARAQKRSYGCYTGKENKIMLIHFGNWLYYKNVEGQSAVIKPYVTALGDNVTLTDVFDDGGDRVDLSDSVSWLAPGMPYIVENVLFAIEMEVVSV